MASGPAIKKRWGKAGNELDANEKVWELEAYYLAQALVNYILILSPEKLIIGGGVAKQKHLLPMVRENVVEMLNGYIQDKHITSNIDSYITSPGLGDDAGIYGGLVLAKRALAWTIVCREKWADKAKLRNHNCLI